MFYYQDRQRADAALHEPILASGNHAKAQAISRAVAKRLGLSDADIDALNGKLDAKRRVDWAVIKARSAVTLDRLREKFDPDEPRDDSGKWTDGGGGDSGGGSGPAATSPTLISPSPEAFIAARNQSTRQHYLSPLKPDDLSDHTLLTTENKKAGVAIDPKGDLQNLYNNGGPKGIAADLVTTAISKGALTLDCYDGYLNNYYHQFGFEETGRMKFDPAFAHGWDTAKDDAPDVVFMHWNGYLNGGEKGALDRAKGDKKDWVKHERSAQYFDDYDKAKEQSRIAAGGKGDRHHAGAAERPPAHRPGNPSLARTGPRDRRPRVARRAAWALAFAQAVSNIRRVRGFDPDEPRDDSGKWTDGGGGGDGAAAKPVPGYSPGIKTPANGQFHHAADIRRQWVDASPIKTIDDLKRVAPESQKQLGDVGRAIAKDLGIQIKDPGTKIKSEKGVARVQAKAAEKYNGSLAAVPDIARIAFLINHPAESDKILAELAKHFEVAAEPWRLTDVNYADRAANVRMPSGLMGEVQIMEPSMAKAKSPDGGGGHTYYVIAREAQPNGIKPDAEKLAMANAKMREIYGKVLDQLPPDWKALFGKAGTAPKSF